MAKCIWKPYKKDIVKQLKIRIKGKKVNVNYLIRKR